MADGDEKQQAHPIPSLVDAQPSRPSDEAEVPAEFVGSRPAGGDGLHGQRTIPREDVQLQVTHHLLGIAGGPFAILPRLRMPCTGGPFKGIEARNAIAFFLHPPCLAGIDAFLRVAASVTTG